MKIKVFTMDAAQYQSLVWMVTLVIKNGFV